MSFFVSKSIKNIIDEETYFSQAGSANGNKYTIKAGEKVLFSKNFFETITFNKKEKIKLIDFILNEKEIESILFERSTKLEFNISKNQKQHRSLKLLKITKIEENKYYCQYRVLGENHD